MALSTAQQNNSAIAEMVESRDSLIDELNDRVAVFEEDKVVLKAALRQLQKEMKDEAPKTQKLLDELKKSKNGKDCSSLHCNALQCFIFRRICTLFSCIQVFSYNILTLQFHPPNCLSIYSCCRYQIIGNKH